MTDWSEPGDFDRNRQLLGVACKKVRLGRFVKTQANEDLRVEVQGGA